MSEHACRYCGQPINLAVQVSVHGMYDCHCFEPYTGRTVDELVDNWCEHNLQVHPAVVGGHEVDDLGPTCLCPAIVLDASGHELRRVGKGIWVDWKSRKPNSDQEVEAYKNALLADPDIPRLLAQNNAEEV